MTQGAKRLEDIQDEGKRISTNLTVIVIAGSPSEFKIKKKLGSLTNKLFATQYLQNIKVGDVIYLDKLVDAIKDQLLELESEEDDDQE